MAMERLNPLIQDVLSIAHGGTGASTAKEARANLGITPENIGAARFLFLTKDLDSTPERDSGKFTPIVFADNRSSDCIGYPTVISGNQALVLNMNIQPNYGAQLAISFQQDKIAIRRKAGSPTWSEWKTVTLN